MWLDNKPVTMLSSNCQPETTTVNRRQKDGSQIEIPCPKSIVSYNKYMGGVDRGDQIRQYYHVRYKSHKNYKYIFWFLFDVSITNSYVLYQHYSTHGKTKNTKDFRLTLGKSLIGTYNSRKMRGRPFSSVPNPTRPPCSIQHFPIKMKTGSKKGVSRCWYCSHELKKRKETIWYCYECEKYLCHTGEPATECFLTYHKEYNLIS